VKLAAVAIGEEVPNVDHKSAFFDKLFFAEKALVSFVSCSSLLRDIFNMSVGIKCKGIAFPRHVIKQWDDYT
jgi:hypothetical protein